MTLSLLALYCLGTDVSTRDGCAVGAGTAPFPALMFIKGFLLPGARVAGAAVAIVKGSGCCCRVGWLASCAWGGVGASWG